MINRLFALGHVAVLFASVAGCSQGRKVDTVPVSGKVTFKGSPLEGATVAFVRKAQQGETAAQMPASGVTDANGVYNLTTFVTPSKPQQGAVPGDYQVTIAKRATVSGPAAVMQGTDPKQMEEKIKNMSPEERAKMGGMGQSSKTRTEDPASEIPERYSLPDQSGLERTVTSGGAQTFDFDLKE